MKKALLPLFFMLTLLTSCNKLPPQDNSYQSASEPSPSEGNYAFVDYPYGTGVGTESGYYFLQYNNDKSFNICYLDYSTKAFTVLCNRVECLHNNEACLGWRSTAADAVIIANEENIFLLFKENSTSSAYYEILDFSGTVEKQIKLPRNSYFAPPFVINNLSLICFNEFFDDEKQETLQQLVQIKLASGELTTLSDSYSGLCHFIAGASQNGVLIKNISVDGDNPTDIANTTQLQTLYEIDFTTKDSHKVFEWETKENKALAINNDLIYINVNDNLLKKLSIDTLQEQTISTLSFKPNAIGSAFLGYFDDTALFLNIEYENDTPISKLYAINIQSGACTEISLHLDAEKRVPIQIVAAWEDYYLVVSSLAFSDVNVEGPDGTMSTIQQPKNSYSLIKKADFLSSNDNYVNFK